jgi:hypothetical protein
MNGLLSVLTARFHQRGLSAPDASAHALAMAYRILEQQAALLASMDCFTVLSWTALLAIPLTLLIRKLKVGASAPAGGH